MPGWLCYNGPTLARKHLFDQPRRDFGALVLELQDWIVPVIYEAAPIQLFPRKAAAHTPLIIDPNQATPTTRELAQNVPAAPDVGFIGRDETLLALDRACDEHAIVLLHAYAGNGKTTAIAEFARWYALTGGTAVVLWTSFEGAPKTLETVLGAVEVAFAPVLEQNQISWLSLPTAARLNVTLQLLNAIPTLWLWDNVEPIAGFPDGVASLWTAAEQRELADFLRAARGSQARFILTSRRDEHGWLGDLPRRIPMLPMSGADRVALLRAIAEKHGVTVFDPTPWRPLLGYTLGNPLTLTVLIGQALRTGLHEGESATKKIKKFVEQLRSGEAQFADDESQGRSKSLGASLSYGFAAAFSNAERAQLALLHLFQGFVDVDALRGMGNPKRDYCLPAVRGLSRESGIALLDRAAAIGLLTPHGGGLYTIHPALPWYFTALFRQDWGAEGATPAAPGSETPNPNPQPLTPNPFYVYVTAIAGLGNYYHNQYNEGNRDVIGVLGAEEANLLHARHLAITYDWFDSIISTMQGLRMLYDHNGRRAAWARLVAEIVPLFVDPASDGPLPGRADQWELVTDYRVRLAQESRDWGEAERLQHIRVEWDRPRASAALLVPPANLDATHRHLIRMLGVALTQLAQIQMSLGQAECMAAYEEAATLYQHIADQVAEAVAAFNLGHAYMNIPTIRDLDQAERWYNRSLELVDERDRLGRGQTLGQLGFVAYERFRDARTAEQPDQTELLRLLNVALNFYLQALELTPANAVDTRAAIHNQLGNIYDDAGDLTRALHHSREGVRYYEAAGNGYGAATTRFNIAITYYQQRRFSEALPYAEEARRNFAAYGAGAAADVEQTQGLIELIKRGLAGGGKA